MKSLHPLQTTNLIRNSYLRYLKTIYPFQDPTLQQQFWQALEKQDMIVKGPLLEASSPFKFGQSIADLVKANILQADFAQLCSAYLPLERPLYLHQEQAVVKAVSKKRNLVVATGTGSGKTEAFLIPIFDHLLREKANGTLSPGVRALLLYPMNALANDQMKRLRKLLANFPDITFGRYTGETEQRQSRAENRFREQSPFEEMLPNELLSREAMQETPPHILLTNYAMLEYLLLRPRDNVFFDGQYARHWHFLVLDEAHVYDGASGMEIAMLLRRLKDRVVKSETGRLHCLATSATLGSQEDYPQVVEFARQLFGETFEWDDDAPNRQDVVEATRTPVETLGPCWGQGSGALYTALQHCLDNGSEVEELNKIAKQHGLSSQEGQTAHVWLYQTLRGDQRLRKLQEILYQETCLLSEVAPEIFPEAPDQAAEYLIKLVDLAVRAKPGQDDMSLLPARYHLFARALEGAFVCLNIKIHPVDKPRLFLTRHETCPHCQSVVVELAVCNRCGTTYIVGQLDKGERNHGLKLSHLSQQPDTPRSTRAYFRWGEQDTIIVDEDELVAAEQAFDQIDEEHAPYTLCLNCGEIQLGHNILPACSCSNKQVLTIYEIDLQKNKELTRCVSCGSRSHSVYRFLTGKDAPASVLATSLYQHIPPDTDEDLQAKPGQGRKLLCFADSRQDAAFFAPYMQRTYEQLLRRRLLLKALLEDEAGQQGKLRLEDVGHRLLQQTEAIGFFTQYISYDERQRLMKQWLMQELIAIDRPISLEGLGLLQFRLVRPERWQAPLPLLDPPWNLSSAEIWNLLELLLLTLRQQGAVTFPDGVDPRDDAFKPRNRALYIRQGKADSKKGIFGWQPTKGSNRRLDILMKLLQKGNSLTDKQGKQYAQQLLPALWTHVTQPIWKDHLVPENLGRKEGVVYRLSHKFWELVPMVGQTSYQCNRCRNIFHINLRGVCPTYRCPGQLEPLSLNEPLLNNNHYRYQYQNLEPIPFQAKEHTAQWRNEEAANVQESFIQGELNALSCSTTFELGVDVGTLQTVLMRNVPPTTANYVQRAGRAGRRTNSAAFALTYAQRRSHDLTHYAEPTRIISGKIHPPIVVIANEKIVRRHVHSVLFAAFFRWAKEEYSQTFHNIGQFFMPEQGKPGPELLGQFVAPGPDYIKQALTRIVPESLQAELEIDDWGWVTNLMNEEQDGAFDIATREVDGDLELFAELEQKAVEHKNYSQAKFFQGVSRTIQKRHLFGFLGSRGVLPKYGFPTDVVELRTSHLPDKLASKVELQRDLRIAIAEYAPGSEVVAGGKIWVSGGIYKYPNRELPVHNYAICASCGHFYRDYQKIGPDCEICGEKVQDWRRQKGRFIIPEFGFIVAEAPKESGETRPQRTYATQVYFAEYDREKDPHSTIVESLSGRSATIQKRYSRHGKLSLVNPGIGGRGFDICEWCGFAQPAPDYQNKGRKQKNTHKHPRTNKECNGYLKSGYHLGHEFITDVLELEITGSLPNQIQENRQHLWRSLLYALLEGASQGLGIRRDDLDGTLYQRQHRTNPSLILFDNVPGGAGHVERVGEALPLVFKEALARVSQDCCGEETSCYECLRNYRNQFYHDQLTRGLARDFIKGVLLNKGPD